MNYLCGFCREPVSLRARPEKFVTIMCKNCGMTIIYTDGHIVYKTKEQYLEWKEKQNGIQR